MGCHSTAKLLESGEGGGEVGVGNADETDGVPPGGAGRIVDGASRRQEEHVGPPGAGATDGGREDFRSARGDAGGGRNRPGAPVGDEEATAAFGAAREPRREQATAEAEREKAKQDDDFDRPGGAEDESPKPEFAGEELRSPDRGCLSRIVSGTDAKVFCLLACARGGDAAKREGRQEPGEEVGSPGGASP